MTHCAYVSIPSLRSIEGPNELCRDAIMVFNATIIAVKAVYRLLTRITDLMRIESIIIGHDTKYIYYFTLLL